MESGKEPGAYTKRGVGAFREVTGTCAGCLGDVTPADAFVIRYATTGEPGGIFHQSCEPKGAQWYAINEAPDV